MQWLLLALKGLYYQSVPVDRKINIWILPKPRAWTPCTPEACPSQQIMHCYEEELVALLLKWDHWTGRTETIIIKSEKIYCFQPSD